LEIGHCESYGVVNLYHYVVGRCNCNWWRILFGLLRCLMVRYKFAISINKNTCWTNTGKYAVRRRCRGCDIKFLRRRFCTTPCGLGCCGTSSPHFRVLKNYSSRLLPGYYSSTRGSPSECDIQYRPHWQRLHGLITRSAYTDIWQSFNRTYRNQRRLLWFSLSAIWDYY